MLFNTAQFGVFLFTVLAIYWGLARFQTARLGFLLGASYYFYASWNATYLALIAYSLLIFQLAVPLWRRFVLNETGGDDGTGDDDAQAGPDMPIR